MCAVRWVTYPILSPPTENHDRQLYVDIGAIPMAAAIRVRINHNPIGSLSNELVRLS